MIASSFTTHASLRLQQRAIPVFIVDLLERFGSEERCGKADRLFFDKKAIKRLKQHFGGARGLRLIDRWLGVYAVIGDNGRVVTIAHRH
jgi:hypothetical protein